MSTSSEAVRVLVAFDSRRGHVERLAAEVAAGAREIGGVEVTTTRVADVSRRQLLDCDALIVGSPVHTGTMSVPVKQFFDDWHLRFDFYPERPMRDRIGAAFAAGGKGDGGREMTLLAILTAMLHHRMIVVSGESPIGASAATEDKEEPIDALELAEARALGRRAARLAGLLAEARRERR